MAQGQSQYEEMVKESRSLAQRNRSGTGASSLLQAQDAPTHYADALDRFEKDFASHERRRRDEEKWKRQAELEKKRIEQLERENRRWEAVESYEQRLKDREQQGIQNQIQGVKRTANSNGLAYNPISLEYDRNPEGMKLKKLDEDAKIRSYVRAHNMDTRGNSKYNPLTGENRVGIQKVIPEELHDRYSNRLIEHYENIALKVPTSANSDRSSPYSRYY